MVRTIRLAASQMDLCDVTRLEDCPKNWPYFHKKTRTLINTEKFELYSTTV
jgi:hypothetical protein